MSQQNFSNLLNDRVWEQYGSTSEKQLLWDKIAFVVHGFKEEYKKDEKKQVDELVEKCMKYGKQGEYVYVAFLFVCAFKQEKQKTESIHLPLIRIRRDDGRSAKSSYFIDHAGRVYKDWSSFLEDNLLDGWWICVPKEGIYSCDSDEVQVEFYDQTKRGKIVKTADKVSTVSNITTAVTMITGTIMTFTPLAPIGLTMVTASAIAGAPGAVYGTGRSISRLVDRGQHDQSISLANAEARGCWISTVASVLSFGNMASATFLVRSAASGGIAISAGVRTFCTTLNLTTISMNGIGVINSIVELARKKPEEITRFEILQLTTSIFFFTNSLVNFKTANQIVKDTQKATINNIRNDLTDEASLKSFDNLLKNTKRQSGKMHGSADFIRGVRHINNRNEFFKALGVDNTVKAKFYRNGSININKGWTINPNAYMQIDEAQRNALLADSSDLLAKKISKREFNKRVDSVVQKNKVSYATSRTAANSRLAKAFGTDQLEQVEVDGRKIFASIKPNEIDRIDSVLENAELNYGENKLQAGLEFIKRVACKNAKEFCAALEFALRHLGTIDMDELIRRFEELRRIYEEANQQIDQQNRPEFSSIIEADNQAQEQVEAEERSDDSEANSQISDSHPFPVERYYEIAREMTAQPIDPSNSRLTESGNSVCITFAILASGDWYAVRFNSLADGESVIATLYVNEEIRDRRLY